MGIIIKLKDRMFLRNFKRSAFSRGQ